MRKMFRGYYYPTDEEFSELWENCIFIFDANILLNIYRYSESTRDLFLKILEKVSNRTIIPYQAAKEYQDNRLKVINDQKKAYNDIANYLDSELKKITNKLNSYKRHPSINKENISSDIKLVFKSIINELQDQDKDHPDFFEKDKLRDELTVLLDGKISKACPDSAKKDIWKAGKERYADKVPPGYKDKKDKDGFKKCGDLALWYQILDIAQKNKKPIILVTDDKKEDWWWEFNGKTIGPRIELIEEMYNEAKVMFYMYKTDNFIERAEKKFFDSDADPSFIKEVKDVMSTPNYFYEPDFEKLKMDKEDDFISNYHALRYPHGPSYFDTSKEYNDILFKIEYDLDLKENEIKLVKEHLVYSKNDMLELRNLLIKKEKELFYLEKKIDGTTSEKKFQELIIRRKNLINKINSLRNKVENVQKTYERLEYLWSRISETN
jgi:hypothetical protein